MPYLTVFGLRFWETIVIHEINTLEFVKVLGFVENLTIFKFSAKNAFFGYFCDAILKTIIIFEISTFELVKLQSFVKK